MSAILRGAAARLGAAISDGLRPAVSQTVRDALADAGMTLADIELVVTIGSDILDGAMVATNSAIAGSYGREIMTVPSSAGHALAAALAMIESGQAATVLVAGWGEGTKFAAHDGRIIQADPFYARPVGADAAALSALMAQRVFATGALDADTTDAYAQEMRRRGAVSTNTEGVAAWLGTGWCDGVCALVLTKDGDGVALREIATSFDPYCPEPDRLDPACWVETACAALPGGKAAIDTLTAIEIGAPTPVCEAAALRALLPAWDDARINRSGGGAVAHFGPASGLARVVALRDALADGGIGLAIDLAGPIGQAASVMVLEHTA